VGEKSCLKTERSKGGDHQKGPLPPKPKNPEECDVAITKHGSDVGRGPEPSSPGRKSGPIKNSESESGAVSFGEEGKGNVYDPGRPRKRS